MSTERFRIKIAVYLVLRTDDKVLLSLRKNTGYKDGWYSLVSGHVDGGEATEIAMARKAKEEAGIDIVPENLRHIFTMHRLGESKDDEYIDLFFECTSWSGDIYNAEPEKCGELLWVGLDQLPENTLNYVQYVLKNYTSGVTYASRERE